MHQNHKLHILYGRRCDRMHSDRRVARGAVGAVAPPPPKCQKKGGEREQGEIKLRVCM